MELIIIAYIGSIGCTAYYARDFLYYLRNEDLVVNRVVDYLIYGNRASVILCDEMELKVFIEDNCFVYSTWQVWSINPNEIRFVVIGPLSRSLSSSALDTLENYTLKKTFYSNENPSVFYEGYSPRVAI